MKIKEVMTRNVRLIEPTDTIRDAARLMAEMDAGIMPVREGDRLRVTACASIDGFRSL
jgi:CBS domain-containing protein